MARSPIVLDPSERQLRFFITYASEDHPAAIALSNALNERLGDVFASVFLDTQSLRAGFDFSQQIQDQLDKTDILLIVYTGRSKSSHSWTGLEIGYFMAVIRDSPDFTSVRKGENNEGRQRRIVSFYLNSPPPTASNIQGIPFGICADDLALTDDEYIEKISSIDSSNPIVGFFQQMESEVDSLRQSEGRPRQRPRDIRELLSCVQDMLKAVFTHLKQSIDIDVNPQKKIIVEVRGELNREAMELPGNAQVIPSGTGAMEIFGLPSVQLSWSEFLERAPDKYRFTWKDVIETVIISSVPDRLDVDNSQIIVSKSEHQIYRVVLSRSVRYFDGRREFHLYFVESLRRGDYGERLTTLLLKGLELACRFRFMFFEQKSEFSSGNLSLVMDKKLKETARNLIKELNLLQRDSTAAHLDEPRVWRDLVELQLLQKSVDAYYPVETDVRKAAVAIINAPEPVSGRLRLELVDAIKRLEDAIGPLNLMFITDLGKKLQHIDKLDRLQTLVPK
jgi:TIR domain